MLFRPEYIKKTDITEKAGVKYYNGRPITTDEANPHYFKLGNKRYIMKVGYNQRQKQEFVRAYQVKSGFGYGEQYTKRHSESTRLTRGHTAETAPGWKPKSNVGTVHMDPKGNVSVVEDYRKQGGGRYETRISGIDTKNDAYHRQRQQQVLSNVGTQQAIIQAADRNPGISRNLEQAGVITRTHQDTADPLGPIDEAMDKIRNTTHRTTDRIGNYDTSVNPDNATAQKIINPASRPQNEIVFAGRQQGPRREMIEEHSTEPAFFDTSHNPKFDAVLSDGQRKTNMRGNAEFYNNSAGNKENVFMDVFGDPETERNTIFDKGTSREMLKAKAKAVPYGLNLESDVLKTTFAVKDAGDYVGDKIISYKDKTVKKTTSFLGENRPGVKEVGIFAGGVVEGAGGTVKWMGGIPSELALLGKNPKAIEPTGRLATKQTAQMGKSLSEGDPETWGALVGSAAVFGAGRGVKAVKKVGVELDTQLFKGKTGTPKKTHTTATDPIETIIKPSRRVSSKKIYSKQGDIIFKDTTKTPLKISPKRQTFKGMRGGVPVFIQQSRPFLVGTGTLALTNRGAKGDTLSDYYQKTHETALAKANRERGGNVYQVDEPHSPVKVYSKGGKEDALNFNKGLMKDLEADGMKGLKMNRQGDIMKVHDGFDIQGKDTLLTELEYFNKGKSERALKHRDNVNFGTEEPGIYTIDEAPKRSYKRDVSNFMSGDWRFIGKEYVHANRIIEPDVLSGTKNFPTAKKGTHPEKVITEFKHSEFKLPRVGEKEGGWHATPKEFSEQTTVLPGSSSVTGLHIAPSTSPHFWELGGSGIDLSISSLFDFSPKPPKPAGLWIGAESINRLPAEVRTSNIKGNEFIESTGGSGKAYITPKYEQGYKGAVMEKEAVISPGTQLRRVRFDQYTQYKGEKIPLMEYEVVKGKGKKGDITAGELFNQHKKSWDSYLSYKERPGKGLGFSSSYKQKSNSAPSYHPYSPIRGSIFGSSVGKSPSSGLSELIKTPPEGSYNPPPDRYFGSGGSSYFGGGGVPFYSGGGSHKLKQTPTRTKGKKTRTRKPQPRHRATFNELAILDPGDVLGSDKGHKNRKKKRKDDFLGRF